MSDYILKKISKASLEVAKAETRSYCWLVYGQRKQPKALEKLKESK